MAVRREPTGPDDRRRIGSRGSLSHRDRTALKSKAVLRFAAGMKRYWGCLGFGILLASAFVSCGGESQNAPDTSERDCGDVRDESIAKLAEADAHTIGECRFQSQCRLFTGNTHCTYGCGWVVATKDEAPLQAAVDEVNALCPDECRQPAPPCVPRHQVADCVGGKCVV